MDDRESTQTTLKRATSVFRRKGGLLRMSDAVRAGVHRDTLRAMIERGDLEKLSRGLYRLIDSPTPTHPDLAAVAVNPRSSEVSENG